jgi:hypothetical protein
MYTTPVMKVLIATIILITKIIFLLSTAQYIQMTLIQLQ